MTTRVTNIQQTKAFIEQMATTRTAIDNTSDELSSGIKINLPSEDPGRAGTITKFQATLQRLDRHSDRISTAVGVLDTQDSLLESASNILLRCKEIAAQAANGTIASDVRATLAEEVFQLRDELVGLANTKYEGAYVYGGADDDDPPFDIADATTGGYNPPGDGTSGASTRYVFDAEAGTDVTRTIQVTDSDNVRINTSGGEVFSDAIAAVERLGRALSGYRTTPDAPALPDGGGTAYNLPDDYAEQSADITECIDLIESAQVNDIQVERTSIGARTNRLTQAQDIIDLVKINTEKARSTIQDADVYESASNLSSLQLSLKALLYTGAQINSMTLLDYI